MEAPHEPPAAPVAGDPATEPAQQPPAEPTGCRKCGAPEVEPGFAAPLCADCRTSLAATPVPARIKAFAALVAVAVVVGIARMPASVSVAVAYNRGQEAEARGDYASAARDYRQVAAAYPDFDDGVARLGIAQFHTGDLRGALLTFRKLEGRKLPKELADEVNGAIDAIGAIEKQGPGTSPGGGQ